MNNGNELSNVPPGAMLEIGLELIDEGKFIKQVNAAIRKAYKDLLDFEKQTDIKTGRASVAVSIGMGRLKQANNHFVVETQITVKQPASPKGATVVAEKCGRLLCQPVGTNDDPEQQLIFDAQGRIIGDKGALIDNETGEVIEKPVAGSIRRAQG